MLILNVLVAVAVLLAVMDSERYVGVCANLANQPTTLAITASKVAKVGAAGGPKLLKWGRLRARQGQIC